MEVDEISDFLGLIWMKFERYLTILDCKKVF